MGTVKKEVKEYHHPSCGIFFDADKILIEENSVYQNIKVFENEFYGNVLVLDGLVQTTEKDEFFYHEMLAHPALSIHPNPRDVLIIGGGDGGVLKEVLRYPVHSVRLVEIDSRVLEVCKEYFSWMTPALADKRVELVIGDGKEFLQEIKMSFDVVLVDSSEPIGPSVSLHTGEFYQSIKARLKPGGVAAAQVGSPFFHKMFLGRMAADLRTVFRRVAFYTGPVPTYPGGLWCYIFLSDRMIPQQVEKEIPAGLRYFNADILRAAFALPAFVVEDVKKGMIR
ncbi:MAG: polyamine aminopropyltransferase [Candidatus Aminicenantes bacterium]|nr:polyamine aminopropyltransferase [Candidatus Aminicenantes bacterium]